MSVYRTSTIKRDRRTKKQVEQLDQQILAVLHEDHPQSVRHVFYRMTNPRLPEPVEKSERGYRHVQSRLKELRRSGRLSYGWITDATRRGYHVNTYNSSSEFISAMAGMYRSNLWRDSQYYVEVWTESRSIAGVIQRDCERLAVSLYPAGGFASISVAHEAAGFIEDELQGSDRYPIIIYIGDYDPAGVLIDQSLEQELRRHLRRDFQFIRLGITPEQIEDYDLPTKPRKATDRRSLHVRETVEAEAMPARVLREMLSDAVESYLPFGALQSAKAAEESERAGLRAIARAMGEAHL